MTINGGTIATYARTTGINWVFLVTQGGRSSYKQLFTNLRVQQNCLGVLGMWDM